MHLTQTAMFSLRPAGASPAVEKEDLTADRRALRLLMLRAQERHDPTWASNSERRGPVRRPAR